ncbi:MAG TPA: DUF5683 domain-containing protein [Bacteroidales bacterium]|nr:DUF5683 domain-containing protein [Bacteroidales bacterium]
MCEALLRTITVLKTLIRILIIIVLQTICFQQNTSAQDSVYFDRPIKHKFTPIPIKATMLAVALPGMGQIYNRKYWKIPLVYAGFGGLAYAVGKNSTFYATYMKAYQDFKDDIPETDSYMKIKGLEGVDPATYDRIKNPQQYSHYQDQMLRLIDYYKRYRDLSYIGIGFWYLITVLDANVDASLFNYDISNNLDIAVMPLQTPLPGGYVGTGINVSLMFNF